MDMTIALTGGKRVEADYYGMKIVTDQPVQAGGEGTAPAPFHLFLASIGTCAGFYVVDFCQHRGIPTEGIRLVQRMHRNPESKMIERIEIEIQLPDGFPDKYRKAVVSAANLCTVKKHILEPPAFEVFATRPSEARLGLGNP